MPGARDKRNALSWRDYALEFPVAAGELAFDFDPVYLAHGMMSRASLASISRLYGAARRPLPKLLATFRDPAVQHCARNRARHVAEDERGEASAFRAAYASCVAALADGAWAAADGACRPPSKAHFHNYCYAEHVAEWAARGFAYRLVKAEELRAEATRGAVVRGVLDWLGLDASALPPGALDDVYNAHGVDELPDEFAACVATMRRPRSYLSACNAALAARERDDRWLWWAPAEDPEPAPPPPHYEEL